MTPPPRLHVLLARDAPVGLILRRGPAAWYHLVHWHTGADRFEPGAWFRGRLYEERCDLSPDGELFLYFALQGTRWRTSYKGSWTAVSRPPWLHALGLWPQGDTWGGGGRFVGTRKVALWTNDLRPHPDHPGTGLEVSSGSRSPFDASSELPSREWSGRDQSGEPVFTSAGKLFRKRGGRDVEIADFNGLRPDPQPPPEWATRPLPPRGRARRKPRSEG